MGYVAPAYNNIIIGDDPTVYNAPSFNNIVIGDPIGTGRYAMIMIDNHIVPIALNLLNTGLSPVILDNNKIRVRATTEGTPLIYLNGAMATLAEDEYLII